MPPWVQPRIALRLTLSSSAVAADVDGTGPSSDPCEEHCTAKPVRCRRACRLDGLTTGCGGRSSQRARRRRPGDRLGMLCPAGMRSPSRVQAQRRFRVVRTWGRRAHHSGRRARTSRAARSRFAGSVMADSEAPTKAGAVIAGGGVAAYRLCLFSRRKGTSMTVVIRRLDMLLFRVSRRYRGTQAPTCRLAPGSRARTETAGCSGFAASVMRPEGFTWGSSTPMA